jgi:carbon monoxide dehydrogenase subunit G
MPTVSGTERLEASLADVWRMLNDPATLASAIPGCNGFERDADNRYRTSITVAVGPVTGVYEGTVEYRDVEAPHRCTIVVEGSGDQGTIAGEGRLTLREEESSTEVDYAGSFRITGAVAALGQRVAPGVSRKIIVTTLRNLRSAAAAPAASPGSAAPADSRGPFRPIEWTAPAAFGAGFVAGAASVGLAALLLS